MAVISQKEIIWEVCDNFQKQTYRNRCYICTDQGKLMLNIPIKHVGGNQGRQLYREVRLDNSYPWQRNHWKTLETAYRSSPFFEFFEEDLASLFTKAHTFLLDFNLATIETICNCLDLKVPTARTERYEIKPAESIDCRFLVNAKEHHKLKQKAYSQVFMERHGFIENLSILDLLFNEGPSASSYLEALNLESLND